MPIYEIETDKGVFEIDADREPTQEEALAAISGQQPSTAPARVPNSKTPKQGKFAGDSMLKDVVEAIPFSNAIPEFIEGQRNGTQIFGDNLAGDLTGLILGAGRAVPTVLNPLGKLIGAVPKVAQAAGSAAGGDVDAAFQDLTGSRPVSSSAEIPPVETGSTSLDTLINGLTGTYNEAVAKQPLALLGLTPKALAQQGTAIRNFPSNVTKVASDVSGRVGKAVEATKNAVKGETPVDPKAVEAAQKKVQGLEYLIEKNKISKTKTAEARNADSLLLQEELARAKAEAESLGSEALKANQELGPQIDVLNQASAEAPSLAGRITSRLPPRQGEVQFGKSVGEEISKTQQEARKGESADYSAVRDSLPEEQPKLEASTLHETARTLSEEESKGLKTLGDKRINAILTEAGSVKVLDNLSSKARDIYDNLPDSQKEQFLRQMGGGLTKEVNPTYTWDDLQKTYQRLNDKISEAVRNEDSNAVRVLTRLKVALSEDMATYAESAGIETKALFDDANSNFAENRAKFGNRNITPLISELAKADPATIVAKIVGEKKASTIESLKQVLSPEKFEQVQSQYANELFSPSKGVPFDAAHFLKTFEKFSDETLRAAFGDEGLKELYRIKDLAESGDKAKSLKSKLDDYNSKAQKAEDAFQKAKTTAEEKAVTDSIRAEAEAVLDAIENEKLKADIDNARAELKKANTPQKISKTVRFLYGVGSLTSALAVGAGPGTAITAGIAAAAFSRAIHRNAGSIITDFLAKKQMAKENK